MADDREVLRRLLGTWIAVALAIGGATAAVAAADASPAQVEVAAGGSGTSAPQPARRASADATGGPTSTTTAAAVAVAVAGDLEAPPATVPAVAPASPPSTIVADAPPFGDPDTEMPAAWVDRCVPGTWDPLHHSCTFRPDHVVGTVRDTTGRPVPGICIGALMATWSRSDANGQWWGEVNGMDVGGGRVWDCGSDGTFGYQSQDASAISVVDRVGTFDVVVVRFGGVRGRVVDSAGRPVAGACVASGGRQDSPPVGPTGADGRYELTQVLPGTYQVFTTPCPATGALPAVVVDPVTAVTTAGAWTTFDLTVSLSGPIVN